MKPRRENAYAEETRSRGIYCFVCGKVFANTQTPVKMEIQGKDRDVHARCKKRQEKIKMDLS